MFQEAEALFIENEEVAEAVKAEPPMAEKDEEPELEESAVPEKVVLLSAEVVEVGRKT